MLLVITPPHATVRDIQQYNKLFPLGLERLLLRLPGASEEVYSQAIAALSPQYRHRVIIADHFHLAAQAGLGGIHLSADKRADWQHHKKQAQTSCITTSTHSFAELASLPFVPTLALLSPVFDSISKSGYVGAIDLDEAARQLPRLSFPVLAMGGITPDRIKRCHECGFAGAAVLGYLAEDIEAIEERFLLFTPPEVLTIAGHDATSGAGITADVRTIEYCNGYPLSVVTTLTTQDEYSFEGIVPVPYTASLTKILQQHKPVAAKIGLVSSLQEVAQLVDLLQAAGVRYIVWDPILQPTHSAEVLHTGHTQELLHKILQGCSLVTPNYPEAKQLFGTLSLEVLQQSAQAHQVAILLKGGHAPDDQLFATDLLMRPERVPTPLSVSRTPYEKHGTGCALSAAIATHLAQGYPLVEACRLSQLYVDNLRRSARGALGLPKNRPWDKKARKMAQYKLQFITHGASKEEILSQCDAALEGGIRWIQLRMKEATTEQRVEVALALKKRLANYPTAVLIINDDVEAALRTDADGVHVGLLDMPIAEARKILGPYKIIGATCNTAAHIAQRALEGVDYIGVGPYRATYTKKMLSPLLGEEGIAALLDYYHTLPLPMPMVVIGGIVTEDIPTLAHLGVRGIAVSGLINQAKEPIAESRTLVQQIEQYF